MARFTVSLTDQTTELIPGADAYKQEGSMTTFFALAEGRETIDSWSSRIASYRTADIVAVRSRAAAVAPENNLTELRSA